jgi:hypothetical protein
MREVRLETGETAILTLVGETKRAYDLLEN